MAVDTKKQMVGLFLGPLASRFGGSLASLGRALVRLGRGSSARVMLSTVAVHVSGFVVVVGLGRDGREESSVWWGFVEAVDDGWHCKSLLGGLLLLERLRKLDKVILDVHTTASLLVVLVLGALWAFASGSMLRLVVVAEEHAHRIG